MRIAVIGHVEHITLGRVSKVPGPGEIAHLSEMHVFAGGGGGLALSQLARSDAEVHLFTALGDDEAAAFVAARLSGSGAHVHAARRALPQTRDIVMIPPGGDRTIVVLGEPLHPLASDPLPWELLQSCDAVYFTAQDPAVLRLARAARLLIATARRKQAIDDSGVRPDLTVGSALDPREAWPLGEYALPPAALVLTEGAAGGAIHTAAAVERFHAPQISSLQGGAYGAGDSFAGALVYYVAAGLPLRAACERAGHHGAAVLGGLDPTRSQLTLSRPGARTAQTGGGHSPGE
jgi:ribokinase